jgi:AraC-like DNA-binding protein
MSEKAVSHGGSGSSLTGKPGKGELSNKANVLDALQQVVSFTQGFLLSTLPRASMQLVQPSRTPESMQKEYTRGMQKDDRAAWQAILRAKAIRGSDAWGRDFDSSAFFQQYLAPHGIRHVVAVPLGAAVFDGYPGVAYLTRGPEDADFSDSEVEALNRWARQHDEQRAKASSGTNHDAWAHRLSARFLVVDAAGQQLYPSGGFQMDERLQQQIKARMKQAIEQSRKGHNLADRVLFPDGWGDLWVFRAVFHKDFPAIGSGPLMFLCLQPDSSEWAAAKPGDLAANPELVRLLPTLRYMQQEFSRNPTLEEIAKRAHLSPFHFHRRFSDLVGQTPKHYLLSCQITQAKKMLVAGKRELSQIATDCGFAHQSHFTSRFKQATGLTPTRWRRMAAQIEADKN